MVSIAGSIPVWSTIKHISLTETGIEYVERGRRFDSFILNFSSVFYNGPGWTAPRALGGFDSRPLHQVLPSWKRTLVVTHDLEQVMPSECK